MSFITGGCGAPINRYSHPGVKYTPEQSSYNNGQTVKFSCYTKGQENQGTTMSTCSDGTWQPHPRPSCGKPSSYS